MDAAYNKYNNGRALTIVICAGAYGMRFVADSCPRTKNSISAAISTCYTLRLGHNDTVMRLTVSAALTTALPRTKCDNPELAKVYTSLKLQKS